MSVEKDDDVVFHPWAGVDGHNCVDCGPDGFWRCCREVHVVPRWDEDPVAVGNGWVEGHCGICGALSHTEAEHLGGEAVSGDQSLWLRRHWGEAAARHRDRTCRHTEHATRSDGLVGRWFPNPLLGGEGLWERCDAADRPRQRMATYPHTDERWVEE